MPDIERMLRDEFANTKNELRLDTDQVIGNVHRRHRRRIILGAVVILGGLTAGGIAGYQILRPRIDAPRTASGASLSPTEAQLDAQVARLTIVPESVTAVDAGRAYAIGVRCAQFGQPESCAGELGTTVDGGATWAWATLPGRAGQGLSVLSLRLYPVGNGVMLDEVGSYAQEPSPPAGADPPESDNHGEAPAGLAPIAYKARDTTASTSPVTPPAPPPPPSASAGAEATPPPWIPGRRWFSSDRGTTWKQVPRGSAGSVATIPAGGRLFFPVADLPEGGVDNPEIYNTRAQVILPDGRTTFLANGPAGEGYTDAMVTKASDGSIWVPGYRTNDKDVVTAHLLVTRDAGRTFRTVAAPKVASPPYVYTADGRTIYLLDVGDKTGPKLFRSTNAGGSWKPVPVPAGVRVQHGPNTQGLLDIMTSNAPDSNLSIAPATDGGLLISNGSGLFRLKPKDTAFTKVTGAPALLAVLPTGRGAVGFGVTAGGPAFFGSTDGATWKPLQMR